MDQSWEGAFGWKVTESLAVAALAGVWLGRARGQCVSAQPSDLSWVFRWCRSFHFPESWSFSSAPLFSLIFYWVLSCTLFLDTPSVSHFLHSCLWCLGSVCAQDILLMLPAAPLEPFPWSLLSSFLTSSGSWEEHLLLVGPVFWSWSRSFLPLTLPGAFPVLGAFVASECHHVFISEHQYLLPSASSQ